MRYFTHAGFCTNINMSLFMLKKESSVFAICLLICSRMQDIIHMFQVFFICIANIMIHAGISFYRMTYNCAAAAGFRTAVTLPEKERIYI